MTELPESQDAEAQKLDAQKLKAQREAAIRADNLTATSPPHLD